jgi:hypothetical protein
MIETVVSMAIMSLAMALFTAAILQVYRITNLTESAATAQTQFDQIFQRLEPEIRYAAGISQPATLSTSQGPAADVEYLTTATSTGAGNCTQLQLLTNTGVLRRRSWPQGATGKPDTSDNWQSLGFGLTAQTPFSLVAPDPSHPVWQLRIQLQATSGKANTTAIRALDITFPALNSSAETASPAVCSAGRTSALGFGPPTANPLGNHTGSPG